MDTRIRYEICPECGFANPEKKGACPVCDNRLISDTIEDHQRYIALVSSEHRKRSFLWVVGWLFVASFFIAPVTMLITGRAGRGSVGAGIISAFLVAWWLIDLGKKRNASARFLAKHRNA